MIRALVHFRDVDHQQEPFYSRAAPHPQLPMLAMVTIHESREDFDRAASGVTHARRRGYGHGASQRRGQ